MKAMKAIAATGCSLALLLDAMGGAALASAGQAVSRAIPLTELGIGDGLEFAGLSGRRDLWFPVGDGADMEGMTLELPFAAQGAMATNRTVKVGVAGRTIAEKSFPDGARGVWKVALPADAARDGFVRVTLDFIGTMPADPSVDSRFSDNSLRFGANSALRVAFAGSATQSAIRALGHAPRPLVITLPDKPDEDQIAAALLLAAERPTSFASPSPLSKGSWPASPWKISRVVFAGDDAPVLSLTDADAPTFAIGGSDPRKALALFASGTPLSATLPAAMAAPVQARANDGRIGFDAFGADLGIRRISDRGGWSFFLPANRAPAGRKLSGLVADVQLAEDGGRLPAVLTVTLNGLILGSRTIRAGEKARLAVDVPKGVATTQNRIDVNVLRQERGGDCRKLPMGQLAQILPSSHAVFDPPSKVADFHDLAAAFAKDVTVAFPDAPGPGAVGALSGVLSGLISGHTPLSVQYGAMPAKGAAIWVSDKAPPGLDVPMPFDRGKVRIRDAEGGTMQSSDQIDALTVVQLIVARRGPVLWVRPGQDFAALADLPVGAELAFGNVAMFDRTGRTFAMHSERERLVSVDFEGDFHLDDWMEEHRIWLVIGAWLVISALFAWLLRQTYVARRDRMGDRDDG